MYHPSLVSREPPVSSSRDRRGRPPGTPGWWRLVQAFLLWHPMCPDIDRFSGTCCCHFFFLARGNIFLGQFHPKKGSPPAPLGQEEKSGIGSRRKSRETEPKLKEACAEFSQSASFVVLVMLAPTEVYCRGYRIHDFWLR